MAGKTPLVNSPKNNDWNNYIEGVLLVTWDAFAVYYLLFTDGHGEKYAEGLIGLGKWGEGSEPEDRTAFPFRIWTTDENYQVGLTDASESPWSNVTFLGKVLDRDEGLKHKWINDVFHITDHIVAEDIEVINYLND